MTPTPPNSEIDLINAISRGLLIKDHQPAVRATGQYADHSRVIELEYGNQDVGPMIGRAGAMKAAIQSLIACPFGADGCQIKYLTTRADRTELQPTEVTTVPFEDVMKALQRHLPPGSLTFRVEASESSVVTIVEATDRLVENLRGPLNKVMRGIGRIRGFIGTVSVEQKAHA